MTRILGSILSLSLVFILFAPPLSAQRLERLAPRTGPDIPLFLPDLDRGQERSRTQLVWNAEQERMTRRTFIVWDPMPSEARDFRWEPGDDTTIGTGLVSGNGRVLWRTAGAATYDHTEIVAEFSGTFNKGRLNGHGLFKHKDGVAYLGDWQDGVMHGMGELSLPNGDVYVGSFDRGRLQGEGVYIEASGWVYRGGYDSNLRQGDGTLTYQTGEVFAAVWRAGEEVSGSRQRMDVNRTPSPVRYRHYDDLSLGVIVDRRLTPVMLGADQPLHYTSSSTPELMRIYPDHPRMLDIWRGTGNLRLNRSESYQAHNSRQYEDMETFLGLGPTRTEPTPIILEFENRTNAVVDIRSAYLDVADSETDNDPAVQLLIDHYSQCDDIDNYQYAVCASLYEFENYGWSDPINAELNFTFDDQTWFRREVTSFGRKQTFRFDAELGQVGVNLTAFRSRNVCTDASVRGRDRLLACRESLASDRDFGRLAEQVVMGAQRADADPNTVGVRVRGTLDYQWQTAKGETRQKSSPFDGYVQIAKLPDGVEVGEGGDPVPISHTPFKFELDRARYRIPLPLEDQVQAGVSGRWKLELEADKSSNHDFRVVFVLADGRRIGSRQINLLFARPRVFPHIWP